MQNLAKNQIQNLKKKIKTKSKGGLIAKSQVKINQKSNKKCENVDL